MKRTILLGKGELAVTAAEWLTRDEAFSLDAIVPVIPEPTWTESLSDWAAANSVATIDSGDYRDLSDKALATGRYDLVISIFYDRIIGADFINQCERIINLHNAPLPKYRGVSPINWALKNGETMHGVTLHEITPGIDDGPIIGQVLFSIYPEIDEVEDVYHRALHYGKVLFESTMPLLDSITPVPQDESVATYYGRADDALLGDRQRFSRRAVS